jgi:hypothetical protein
MNPEIIGAIITAFTTLISALIGAWVAIRVERIKSGSKDIQNKPLNTIYVVSWSIVGALIGATITLLILGKIPFSSKYDNFNNPFHNEKINTELWKRLQDLNCDVKQSNGTALFQINELSDENTLCFIRMPNKVKLSEVGQMEAMLQANNNARGDFSLTTIEFQSTGFSPDTIWIAQCGIIQKANENRTVLFFNLDNSYPNGNPETYSEIPATNEEWYKIRLEIDPDSGTTRCYVNEKVIGSHYPSNVDTLKTQLFNRHITGFWSPQSEGSYLADDVILLLP